MTRQIKTMFNLFLMTACAFVFAACNMHVPGQITENRIQVEQKSFLDEQEMEAVDAAYLSNLAMHYERHGKGPVEMVVGYDPKSRNNTAMSASDDAANIISTLRRQGVAHVEPSILPIKGLGEQARVIFSYAYYDALAPKDCTTMAGYENSKQIEVSGDYKMGCTVETIFAKQIARPKDLAGQVQQDQTDDGRRAANTVERYRTGVPNPPLGGESSSGTAD